MHSFKSDISGIDIWNTETYKHLVLQDPKEIIK